ncbi:unnamed protein product [Closterium sp. Naga37s-1]|nr:unnamed protein product [Closterium sp. Naga37s-1]
MRFFYVTDVQGEPVKAVPCFYAYPGDFIEHCRATATLQTGTKRPYTTCYVEDSLLPNLEHRATPRTVASELHCLRNMLACKKVKDAEAIQTEWSTHPVEVMPILVADKAALAVGKVGELAALRVRAFRMYATFYKAFLGVSGHTETTLAVARMHAIKLVEILPQAYPDHPSQWRFPKIHIVQHLLDNVMMRGMPHHYSTEMWEHTHKGTVKVPVRGSNWKDIPRRIVEEEVQREICREVAQDAGGGRQYATALREAVQAKKPVLTRKGRKMRPAAEGDVEMAKYHSTLGELMDDFQGCVVAAGITASEVMVSDVEFVPVRQH